MVGHPEDTEIVPVDAGCPTCFSLNVLYVEYPDDGFVMFDCYSCGLRKEIDGVEAIILSKLLAERIDHPERFELDPRRN